jgi:hypothetical protein
MQNANEIVFNGKVFTRDEPKSDSPHIGSYLERAQDAAIAGAAAAQRQLQAEQRANAKKLQREERAQAEFLKGRVRQDQLFRVNPLAERG